VAVGAAQARDAHGLERIAVVDFDVHHGNGTQAMFWDDADLFYASTHQAPFYPGTGAVGERGAANNIVNLPLSAMSGSEEFRRAMSERLLPALNAFRPDFLLVSAGFDAHLADPLARLHPGRRLRFAGAGGQRGGPRADAHGGLTVGALGGTIMAEANIPADIRKMSFEQALEELKQIVERLEQGQGELDQAIEAYQRGALLKQHCEAKQDRQDQSRSGRRRQRRGHGRRVRRRPCRG
jgi:exodeoxyribonuclease VII small subunit